MKVQDALRKKADQSRVHVLQKFFKTGPGQYAESDIFIGVKVPSIREVAKQYRELEESEIKKLVHSKIHEERLLGLIILTLQYKKADPKTKEKIYWFYLKNRKGINNWDLVDVTAPLIVGAHLLERDKSILYRLAKSKRLWDRRLAIVSTLGFIRKGQLQETFRMASQLLKDKEDLIHKAVGWMLREAGQKDEAALERFLNKHGSKMPRTMLRYSIERLPTKRRIFYLESTKT